MSVYKLHYNLFKKYPNRVFVETGSYKGDGIQLAIEAGFEHIYSIELSDKYYRWVSDRFKWDKYVYLYKGDSSEILGDVIRNIKEPITFWLDGHYSKEDTAIGKYCVPLIPELEQIKQHPIKTHTVIIDDMRCWQKPSTEKKICVNCKYYPCEHFYGFYAEDLISKLKEINPDYHFIYEDGFVTKDILIAKP